MLIWAKNQRSAFSSLTYFLLADPTDRPADRAGVEGGRSEPSRSSFLVIIILISTSFLPLLSFSRPLPNLLSIFDWTGLVKIGRD